MYDLEIVETYVRRWPGTLPDTLQLTGDQVGHLTDYCRRALQRGSPLTAQDFGLERWESPDPLTLVI